MNKLKLLFLSLIFTFPLLLSCERDYSPFRTFVPKSILKWMYFQKGTYWTYQLESSSEIETIVVDSSKIEMEKTQDKNGEGKREDEVFTVYTHSLSSGLSYTCYGLNGSINGKCRKEDSCTLVMRTRNDIVGVAFHFVYPVVKNAMIGTSTVENIYDSLIINGKTYYHVAEIHNPFDASEDVRETRFFIAKNVGTIRKEIYSSGQLKEQWNLIDSKIIQ